jgi:hypothetical protein
MRPLWPEEKRRRRFGLGKRKWTKQKSETQPRLSGRGQRIHTRARRTVATRSHSGRAVVGFDPKTLARVVGGVRVDPPPPRSSFTRRHLPRPLRLVGARPQTGITTKRMIMRFRCGRQPRFRAAHPHRRRNCRLSRSTPLGSKPSRAGVPHVCSKLLPPSPGLVVGGVRREAARSDRATVFLPDSEYLPPITRHRQQPFLPVRAAALRRTFLCVEQHAQHLQVRPVTALIRQSHP